MEILKIVEILERVSQEPGRYECDEDFFEAVSEAASLLVRQGEKIAELEESQCWIPVTERLPEKEGTYLVYTERGSVYASHLYTKSVFTVVTSGRPSGASAGK